MKNSIYQNPGRLVFLLIMIALASLAVRILVGYRFHESALLYVGIPFVIALVLILLRPVGEVSWKKRYLIRLADAFIIMFGSSIVLFEGFVCVAMFMPIYLFVMLVMFLTELIRERSRKQGRGTVKMHMLPLLLVFSSFEGVSPQLSFDRDERVSVTKVIPLSVAQIKQNLQKPMDLQTARPWFLHLFPMPHDIKAGSLGEGDVHVIYFRYYRWFITNLHEGLMLLKLTEVSDTRIRTTFIEDTSYFSNYLRLKGTEITMQQIDASHTRVTLLIEYERTLDPYWYFSPVSRYGVAKTAEFLITEVIAHENK